MNFRLIFSFAVVFSCRVLQQNDSLFCSFMMYHLCRSIFIAFQKPTKLGLQWERISFSSLAMQSSVIDASQVFVILARWGIFVVSAAVLQWHGSALCCIWRTCRETFIFSSVSAWLGGITARVCLLHFAGSCQMTFVVSLFLLWVQVVLGDVVSQKMLLGRDIYSNWRWKTNTRRSCSCSSIISAAFCEGIGRIVCAHLFVFLLVLGFSKCVITRR